MKYHQCHTTWYKKQKHTLRGLYEETSKNINIICIDYAFEIAKELNSQDIRVQVDDRNEKIGRKIRDNELKRIPFMLIVGEKEAENGEVSVRRQGEGDKGAMKVAEFAKLVNDEVNALVSKY